MLGLKKKALKIKSVLIVDDDETLSSLLSDILIEAGFSVMCVESVSKAKVLLNNQAYSCVLLDLDVNTESGYRVIDHLRSNTLNINFKTSILIHSGCVQMDQLVNYKTAIDGVVIKPSKTEDLVAKIQSLSDKHHNGKVFNPASATKKTSYFLTLGKVNVNYNDEKDIFHHADIKITEGADEKDCLFKLKRQKFIAIVLGDDMFEAFEENLAQIDGFIRSAQEYCPILIFKKNIFPEQKELANKHNIIVLDEDLNWSSLKKYLKITEKIAA